MEKKRKAFRIDPKFERKIKPGDNFSDIMNAALGKYFYEEQQRGSAYLQLIKDTQLSLNGINEEVVNIKNEISAERESMRNRTDHIFNMVYYIAAGVDFLKDKNAEELDVNGTAFKEEIKKDLIEKIEEVKNKYKKLKAMEESKK